MSGLLFVLDAVLISLMCVGALTSLWPVRRIRVTRQAPPRGVEGGEVPIEISLESGRTARLLMVTDGWPGARGRTLVPHVSPGERVTVIVTPLAPRRGEYTLGPIEVASRGTVGLFVARRRFGAAARMTIWSRTRQVPAQVLVYLAPALEARLADRTRDPEELYGLRDYQLGDSLARIHWRSSARRGSLVVREFERPQAAAATLVLDLDRRQRPARLDAAVRAAASVLRLAHERHAELVLAGWEEGPIERRGWEAAMDWLARVAPCAPPLAEVLPALTSSGGHLIVVASSVESLAPQPRVTPILPAEDLTATGQAYSGLVYTEDGMVQAW
jgi:uncharacterized protein (DUF58 family)